MERIRYKRIITLTENAKADFVDWENSPLIPKIDCERPFLFPKQKYCLTHQPEKMPSVALLGDSHAFHAYWGLSETLAARGDNLTLLGKGACVPLLNYARGEDRDHCQPHMNQMLNWVAVQPEIREVILVFRGRYLSQDSSAAEIQAFASAVDLTLSKMHQAGKRVTYLLPIAEPGFDPRLCMGVLPLGRKGPAECSISKTANQQADKIIRESMMSGLKKHPTHRWLDPNALICSSEKCPVIVDGRSLFKDENHLSVFGSRRTGAVLPP